MSHDAFVSVSMSAFLSVCVVVTVTFSLNLQSPFLFLMTFSIQQLMFSGYGGGDGVAGVCVLFDDV